MTTPNSTDGPKSTLGKIGAFLSSLLANFKWSVAGIVGILSIIAIGSLIYANVVCKGGGEWEAKYKAYRDSAQAAAIVWTDSMRVEVANAWKAADGYRLAANVHTQEVTHLAVINDKLQTINDSLNHTLDSLIGVIGPLNPIVCRLCLELRDSLNVQVANLDRQIEVMNTRDSVRILESDFLRTAFGLEQQISDSLRTIIIHMPTPKAPPRLFRIFNVNLEQSFVGGVIVGTFIGIGTLLVVK